MEPDGYTLNNDITDGPPPVKGVWDNFGQPLINLNSYVSCDDNTPLAIAVLDAYEIPYTLAGHGFSYGTLKDMDIKRMDAMTVLRNSLMEESFAGPQDRFIEAIVNADGEVVFKEIGTSSANISDVYYSIQTGQYVDRPRGVMVTGGKPVPEMQALHWSPIWVADGGEGAPIYAAHSMLQNCMAEGWKSYATIVFNDPHLESTYEDGIDNLYEITAENPWDEILGYCVCIDPGASATTKTTIQYNTEAEIPIQIAVGGEGGICPIGNLQNMPTYDPKVEDQNCWQSMTGEAVNYADGVPVVIPERFRFENVRGHAVDKFVSVTNVYIIGKEIDALYARPKDDEKTLETITEENSNIWITQNNVRRTSYKLDEGRHYAVAFEDLDGDGFQEISIVFSQEVREHDEIIYGNGDGGGVEYYLDPMCAQAKKAEFSGGGSQRATILPWNKTKGIFVEEIWVTVKVETPSITIYDPDGRGERALRIAEDLQYYITPLVMRTPPAPIGYKSSSTSEVIDQVPSKRDNDPTTQQDFDDTPMEEAMDEMQGSGMAITFGFLTGEGGDNVDAAYESAAEESLDAAETIYNMINDDVTETVYTCGPGARPELGDKGPAQGIINSIKYSYSDQGSYTISVSEGPAIVGNLVQVDGGPTQKMAEDNSSRGTVVQALGDNIHFKVRIDGFGERWAVNTSHNVIREHDVVQCTVHNNPVEA